MRQKKSRTESRTQIASHGLPVLFILANSLKTARSNIFKLAITADQRSPHKAPWQSYGDCWATITSGDDIVKVHGIKRVDVVELDVDGFEC